MAVRTFWDAPDHRLIAFFLSVYFIAMTLEFIFQRRSRNFRDTLTNVILYVGFFVINLFWIPIVYQIFVVVHEHSLFKIGEGWYYGEGPWISWLLIFLLDDLCYYWFHRISHKFAIFWASHSTHHSSKMFNLSVGLRQTWIPFYAFLFWLPLAFIGFDPLMILTMQLVSLALQGFLHTEAIRSYGVLDHVLNSPSHHRVHHGTQPKYVDRNFGAVLIIWDKLFGTFQPEEEKPEYGISETVGYNPLRIAFGGFLKLIKKGA